MCNEWLCYCGLGDDEDVEKDLNSSAPTHKGRALCSGQCVCFRVHCQLVQITQKGIVQWVVWVFQGTLSAGADYTEGHCAVGGVGVSGYTVSWCRLHRRALCSGWCECFRVHCQLVQITQKGIVQWVVWVFQGIHCQLVQITQKGIVQWVVCVFQGTLSAGTAVCTRRGEPRSTGGGNVSHQLQPVQSMLMEAIDLVCS